MISYKDELFIETKTKLLEQRRLQPPFSALAEWIGAEFAVRPPINIRFKPIEPLRERSRLDVIFKDTSSALHFRIPDTRDYDPEKMDHVIENFRRIAAGSEFDRHLKRRMTATFRHFERPARWEANSHIPDDQIERMQQELADLGIWKVHPLFAGVTFFFENDEQLLKSKTDGSRAKCEALYAKAIKPFDTFGFFVSKPVEAKYDSKEAFERDFAGNWFYYNR